MRRNKMKKFAIIGIAAVAVVAAGSVGYATVSNDCGYDEKGQFHKGGKVYAFGTMDDARACASKGILPEVVSKRLGIFGSSKEANEIKALNAKVIADKKAAEEAARKAAEEAAAKKVAEEAARKAAEEEAAKKAAAEEEARKAAALLLLEAAKEKAASPAPTEVK